METHDIRINGISYRARKISDWFYITADGDNKYIVVRKVGVRLQPFVRTKFTSYSKAEEFVKWFESTYKDYLHIWKDYPNADLPTLCQWSVKNGLDIKRIIDEVKRRDTV